MFDSRNLLDPSRNPLDPAEYDTQQNRARAAMDAANRESRLATYQQDRPEYGLRSYPYGRAWQRTRNRVALLLVAVGALVVVGLLAFAPPSDHRALTGDEILQRAREIAASPASAGIETLFVEQTYRTYYLGDAARGRVATELHRKLWYEGGQRQRIEDDWTEFTPDGAPSLRHSTVRVWDGASVWTYSQEGTEKKATQVVQDTNVDPWHGLFGGGMYLGGGLANSEPSACGSASLAGPNGIVADRSTYVFDAAAPQCGFVLPGTDGRTTLQIDDPTGLVLMQESHDRGHEVGAAIEVTQIAVNEPISPSLFTYTPPAGVDVDDLRPSTFNNPTGSVPQGVSLAEARAASPFAVTTPTALPDGFQLKWLQLQPDPPATPGGTTASVMLRYSHSNGVWLAIDQGHFGTYLALAERAPDSIPHGTTTVGGAEATWVSGRPVVDTIWEPGLMTILTWQTGTAPNGTPERVALASNGFTLAELRAIAESMR